MAWRVWHSIFCSAHLYQRHSNTPRRIGLRPLKVHVHAVYFQQAQFRSDRLELEGSVQPVARTQPRRRRALRPARRHPHVERRLTPAIGAEAPSSSPPRASSTAPSGRFFLCPALALKCEGRINLFKRDAAAKKRLVTSEKHTEGSLKVRDAQT